MATKSNKTLLNEGLPDPDPGGDLDLAKAYGNAWVVSTLGKVADPTSFGDFMARVSTTVTGATVSNESHIAALPGPILHVEATTGSVTGPVVVTVVAAPATGEARITTDSAGIDTIEFNAGDAVTECAFRQLQMSTKIIEKLADDSDPAIST